MAKLSVEEILSAIDEMTVLELNDLVKACEEKYGRVRRRADRGWS